MLPVEAQHIGCFNWNYNVNHADPEMIEAQFDWWYLNWEAWHFSSDCWHTFSAVYKDPFIRLIYLKSAPHRRANVYVLDSSTQGLET